MMYTDNHWFEWDPKKAQSNWIKHGVSFEEAAFSFDDPLRVVLEDEKHSVTEKRHLGIAEFNGRILTVVFTIRGDATRIINARKSSRYERSLYEAQTKTS